MKEYDVIIVGSGAGMSIGEKAIGQEFSTAVIDDGPAGGTCLNVGCIPSKLLITPADRIMKIKEAKNLGVNAEIKDIDFPSIMKYMHEYVDPINERIRDNLREADELDFYETPGKFVDDHLMEVDGKKIYGERIYLASGSRPFIPDVQGLSDVDYLTNETLLDLKEIPESMVIIGGGYIAAEYAHFFSAMGTEVTIMQMDDRIVPNEEPEISALLEKKLGQRMQIFTGTKAEKVEETADGYKVFGNDKEVKAQKILVAAGRKSNADRLNVQATEVETNDQGYIKVNEYFETTMDDIWAFGDAIGKEMFTHVSREEAEVVWHNSMHQNKKRIPFDYSASPHAIFTHPQIASCGLTQKEAEKDHKILVGKAYFRDVVKGAALREEDGFAKAIVDHENGKILGFHIIGPYAPILIQEVVNAMALGGTPNHVVAGMHIHPAMSEVVSSAFGNLSHPEDHD